MNLKVMKMPCKGEGNKQGIFILKIIIEKYLLKARNVLSGKDLV